MSRSRADSYEDFYERAFSTGDVTKIFEEGGGISFNNFFEASKDNIKNGDYHRAMFQSKLGQKIFKTFFRSDDLTQNVRSKAIVRSGFKINFGGKIYRGGQFIPKALIAERAKRR